MLSEELAFEAGVIGAKRIEFFRREDGARTSGVGVDAGGKTSLNYGGQRRLGDLA